MSSTSSDVILSTNLNELSAQLNRYLSAVILLFGTIGNIFDRIAFFQRTLRSNPCAALFLASSIASLVTLISGVGVRFLAGWSIDLTDTLGWLCKLRIFVLFIARTIASWLITLATIDRCLSSSVHVHRRRMSTLKNAKLGMIIIICSSSLTYSHIFYCYEANLINSPVKCYERTWWCRILIDLEFTFICVIILSLLMFIFGLMTIIYIRRAALCRIQPLTLTTTIETSSMNRRSSRSKKMEHHLLVMLFIQVIFLTLFSLPQAIQNLYSNVTLYNTTSPFIISINNFIFNLFFLLTYVTNGIPFYIYTLTGGNIFRVSINKCNTRNYSKI